MQHRKGAAPQVEAVQEVAAKRERVLRGGNRVRPGRRQQQGVAGCQLRAHAAGRAPSKPLLRLAPTAIGKQQLRKDPAILLKGAIELPVELEARELMQSMVRSARGTTS